jgi:regulator of sirC expression with transglutaminase-like and TPR domain
VLLPPLPVDALWSDAGLRRIPIVTLGLILGEADIAAQALELVIDSPGIAPELRQKALLYEARFLLVLDLDHAAIHVYERFLREYPDVPGAGVVKEKLDKLVQG